MPGEGAAGDSRGGRRAREGGRADALRRSRPHSPARPTGPTRRAACSRRSWSAAACPSTSRAPRPARAQRGRALRHSACPPMLEARIFSEAAAWPLARLRVLMLGRGRRALERRARRPAARGEPGPEPVRLAPVALPGGLGEHKWRDRRLLDELAAAAGAVPLIVDLDGDVLEAAYANVFIVEGDPPRHAAARRASAARHGSRARAGTARGPRCARSASRSTGSRAADELLLASSIRGIHPARLAAASALRASSSARASAGGAPRGAASEGGRAMTAQRPRLLGTAPGGYFGRALVVDVGTGDAERLELPERVLRGCHRRRRARRLAHAPARAAGRRPARARGAARVRVLAARRHAAHDQREVRRRREVAAHRPAERRARLEPLRHRGQAHRQRRDRRPRRRAPTVRAARRRRRRPRSCPRASCGGSPPRTPRSASASTSAAAWRVAAIGPAGERLVRYATVSHDGRHAGRGGLGAVLGAKNIKAVAVSGRRRQAAARRPGRRAGRRARTCAPAPSAPPPPSTASSARSPTSWPSTRSTRCPRATSAPRRSRGRRSSRPRSCTSCARGARQLRLLHDRLRAHLRRARAAARSASSTRTSSRSARCAGSPTPTPCSPPAPLRRPRHRHDLRRRHDRLGDGVRRARPDRRALAAVRRRPTRCCARSTRSARATGSATCSPRARAAPPSSVGQGSAAFAPHVKGLELPGYEPRTLHAMALGLAVNARGADHNRSGAYEADLSGELDRLAGGDAARRRRDRDRGPRRDHGLADPVQVPARRVRRARCPEWARAARAGHRLGRRRAPSCARTARRIVLAKRLFNLREGWTPRGGLAARALPDEPLELDSGPRGRRSPPSACGR